MSGSPSYLRAVAMTATNIAATGADEFAELSEISVSRTRDTAEGNYLGGDGHKRVIPLLVGTEISLSGHYNQGDSVQEVLREAFEGGAEAWLHLIRDPDAAAAAHKGTKYAVIVTSFEESSAAGDAVTFSASLSVNGAPTEIVGS